MPPPSSGSGSLSRSKRDPQRFLLGRRQEEVPPKGLELFSKVSISRYKRSGVLWTLHRLIVRGFVYTQLDKNRGLGRLQSQARLSPGKKEGQAGSESERTGQLVRIAGSETLGKDWKAGSTTQTVSLATRKVREELQCRVTGDQDQQSACGWSGAFRSG